MDDLSIFYFPLVILPTWFGSRRDTLKDSVLGRREYFRSWAKGNSLPSPLEGCASKRENQFLLNLRASRFIFVLSYCVLMWQMLLRFKIYSTAMNVLEMQIRYILEDFIFFIPVAGHGYTETQHNYYKKKKKKHFRCFPKTFGIPLVVYIKAWEIQQLSSLWETELRF